MTPARSDAETAALAASLDERMRAAYARGEALDAALASLRASRGDTAAADDEHDPEGATAADEWARLTGLRRQADAELDALADAVGRLHEGTYGICVVCGRPIPLARLEAVPAATMCVECAGRIR